MHCMSDVEVPDNVGRVEVEGGVVSQWLNEAACWCVSCRKDAVGGVIQQHVPQKSWEGEKNKGLEAAVGSNGATQPSFVGPGRKYCHRLRSFMESSVRRT